MVFSESKDSRNIMTTVMKNDDMYITPDCTNVKDIYENDISDFTLFFVKGVIGFWEGVFSTVISLVNSRT